jgi:hypothetical protein
VDLYAVRDNDEDIDVQHGLFALRVSAKTVILCAALFLLSHRKSLVGSVFR